MCLNDLIGQESGIVVYDNERVIVCNWSSYDDDCFPVVMSGLPFPIGLPLAGFGVDECVETFTVKDIRKELPQEFWILCDINGDIGALFEDDASRTEGRVYIFPENTKVIAPIGWI